MSIWTSSMLSAPPQTEDVAELRVYLKTTINQLAVMMKELDYVLNGQLDVKNVRAQSIDATRLNVDKLSAITADMGKLTSGEIYGAYIATADGTYPRSEMDVTGNFFAAYLDASHYVIVSPEYSGSPSIYFKAPANQLILSCNDTSSSIDSEDRLFITSAQDINIDQGTGHKVNMQSTSALYFNSQGSTLADILGSMYGLIAGLDARITALGG